MTTSLGSKNISSKFVLMFISVTTKLEFGNCYFTKAEYGKLFVVVLSTLNVIVVKINNRNEIGAGEVLDIFEEKSCLNDMPIFSGAREDRIWDGNSFFHHLFSAPREKYFLSEILSMLSKLLGTYSMG